MSGLDWIVRGGRTASGDVVDIGIADGLIASIAPALDDEAPNELDASRLLVLPGAVDPHVHFNEPGERTHWEGWATGSAAAAAGGCTTVIEMPLNALPPTTTVAAFDAKVQAATRNSYVDFALWAGVVPGNLHELEPLAERGVAGFKAFMLPSGVADFPGADPATLLDAMEAIARTGLPLLLHAESDALSTHLTERVRAAGGRTMRDYIDTRPAVVEAEAVARAVELAYATGCRVHIVHISTARAVWLVDSARADGVDITCEVTPHHLLLTDEDAVALGSVAKCAPPLRPREELNALWDELEAGRITLVASDHSPAPPELKQEDDMFASWGGIACVQSTLELLLTEERLPLGRVAELTSTAAARRFGLAGKGVLEVGADADLALVELGTPRTLAPTELRQRHPQSAFLGRRLTARVRHTLLRGDPIDLDGPPRGQLQKPSR